MPTIENLVINSNAEVNEANISVYNGPTGSGTRSKQSDGGAFGSGYVRNIWTANSGGVAGFFSGSANSKPVTENTVYTASSYIRPSKLKRIQVGFEPKNSGGSASGANTRGAYFDCPPGVWTRINFTAAMPPNTVSTVIVFYDNGSDTYITGDTLDIDAICLTQTDFLTSYFEGVKQYSKNDLIFETMMLSSGSIQDREVSRLRALVGAGADRLSLNDLYTVSGQPRRIR